MLIRAKRIEGNGAWIWVAIVAAGVVPYTPIVKKLSQYYGEIFRLMYRHCDHRCVVRSQNGPDLT